MRTYLPAQSIDSTRVLNRICVLQCFCSLSKTAGRPPSSTSIQFSCVLNINTLASQSSSPIPLILLSKVTFHNITSLTAGYSPSSSTLMKLSKAWRREHFPQDFYMLLRISELAVYCSQDILSSQSAGMRPRPSWQNYWLVYVFSLKSQEAMNCDRRLSCGELWRKVAPISRVRPENFQGQTRPPILSRLSMTMCSTPFQVNFFEAARPAKPAPIMMTSWMCSILYRINISFDASDKHQRIVQIKISKEQQVSMGYKYRSIHFPKSKSYMWPEQVSNQIYGAFSISIFQNETLVLYDTQKWFAKIISSTYCSTVAYFRDTITFQILNVKKLDRVGLSYLQIRRVREEYLMILKHSQY